MLLVSREQSVSLGQFIQAFGNQEGSHADLVIDAALAQVDSGVRFALDERRIPAGPPLVIAIAEYVVWRATQLGQNL